MIKLKYILFAFLITVTASSAQNKKFNRPRFSPQEFMQKQEAFITRDARLTSYEAANLFPLYHQLGRKKFEVNRKIWALARRARSENLSEKEAQKILGEIDKLELSKVKLDNNYHQKFRKVISTAKVLRVIEADHKFDRFILEQMSRRPHHPRPFKRGK